jgi:hypothetical protein
METRGREESNAIEEKIEAHRTILQNVNNPLAKSFEHMAIGRLKRRLAELASDKETKLRYLGEAAGSFADAERVVRVVSEPGAVARAQMEYRATEAEAVRVRGTQ